MTRDDVGAVEHLDGRNLLIIAVHNKHKNVRYRLFRLNTTSGNAYLKTDAID